MGQSRISARLWSAARLAGLAALTVVIPGCGRPPRTPTLMPAPPPAGAAIPTLTPGASVEGRLAGGEQRAYALSLGAEQYLRIVATQTAGDVALSLAAPGGAVLKETDATDKSWIPERLSAVTAEPGEHLLTVRAVGDATAAYRLTLEEARPAQDADRERVTAEDLFQRGMHLSVQESVDPRRESIAALQQAADRWRDIGDLAGAGRALHELGYVQFDLGDRQAALGTYEQALAARREAGDQAGVVTSLDTLVECLGALGRADEAHQRGDEALALSRRLGDPNLEALTLNNLGFLAFNLARFAEAAELFAQAVTLRRQAGDVRGVTTALGNLAASDRNLGQIGAALKAYQEALELARQEGDTGTEATVLQNLGVLYKARGDLQPALDVYRRAVDLAVAIGRRSTEASAASNLGELYALLGDPDRALEILQRALEADRAIGSRVGQARDLMEIGSLDRAAGRLDEAQRRFEDAAARSREARDPKAEALALQGLGRTALTSGDPRPALELLDQALALQQQEGSRPGRVETQHDRGAAFLALNDPEQAADAFADSLTSATALGDRYGEAAAHAGLARVERRRGDLEAARGQLEAGLGIVESLRAQVLSPDLRASFLASSQDDYVYLADVLMDLDGRRPGGDFAPAAFAVSERARARSLVELLSEAHIDVREGVAPELAEEEKELDARLWLTRGTLIRQFAAGAPDSAKVDSLRQRLDEIDAARDDLEWRIRREHPRYADLRYPQPLNLAEVQALLAPDAALLEYLLGPQRSYLFVATRDDFAAYPLPSHAEIAVLVRDARAGLESPDRRLFGSLQVSAGRLYDALVAPAAARLADKTHLIVAPDAELYYLPFEALLTSPPGASPAYLLERWAVSYVPSASVLASLAPAAPPAPTAPAPKVLLAFGDPVFTGAVDEAAATRGLEDGGLAERSGTRWRRLPGSRQEVTAVAALYGAADSAVFLGANASEHNFETSPDLAGARVIHLASHAVVDERQPARSALLLSRAPGDAEDGRLEANEIFNLRLGADLVVLSACETALGKEVRGEGLIGLTRAFLYAGARRVAVSLWPVADQSTAELMVAFHRELRDGREPSAALRRAKLAALRSGRWRQPYYWAPFVLVGASDKLQP